MKKVILFLIIGCTLPVLAGFIFLTSGSMPVATKGLPLPFEKLITQIAIHAAIGSEENKTSPIAVDDPNLLAGAKVYVTNCAVCHGVVNQAKTTIAKGLFPPPPQLFESTQGVTDDLIGEIYWKVKNGLRLTGMPGFVDSLTDTEIWQVSELLLNAEKLPAQVQSYLTQK